MSPLEIEILLHYYYCPGDYQNGDFSAPAVEDAIERFRDVHNLLEPTQSMDVHHDPHYRITERGRVFVEALCNMPLPIKTWVMPKRGVAGQFTEPNSDGDAARWAFLEKNPWRAIDILTGQCSTDPTRWSDEAREAVDLAREAAR